MRESGLVQPSDFQNSSALYLLTGKRYFWLVFFVGLLATVVCGVGGLTAYLKSRSAHLDWIHRHHRVLAQHLASEIDSTFLPQSQRDLLEQIENLWNKLPIDHSVSILMVIGPDARILVHSQKPEAVGMDVTEMESRGGVGGRKTRMGVLVQTRTDWAVDKKDGDLGRQVAAISYSRALDGLVVIHNTEALFNQELLVTARPWIFAYSVSVFGLWPACLLLAYLGFRRFHKKMSETERQLQARLNEVEHIYATAPIGLGLLDRKMRIVRLNKQLTLFRGSGETPAGTDFHQFWPDLANRIESSHHHVVATGQPVLNAEFHRDHADQMAQDFLVSLHPLKSGAKKVIGVGMIVQDITHRKLTERALAKSETMFRTLVENSHDVINLFDAEGRLIYTSPSIRRVLGYSPAERIGTVGVDIIHPDDLEQAVKGFEEFLTKPGVVGHFTYRLRHRDGSYRTVEVTGTNMLNDPAVGAMVSIFRDVTAQKKAQQALVESERRYRTLVENAPEAIVVLDVDEARFVDGNENAAELFGCSIAQLRRMNPEHLSPLRQPDGRYSAAAARELIEQALAGKTPVFEWTHCDSHGREFVCEIRLVRLPSTDRRLVRGSITDITERQNAEAAFREHQTQLAHVSRLSTLGEMVAGIAHEINQPLASVSNFANACIHTLTSDKPDLKNVIEWTCDIRDETDRAAEIIRRFGNFTRKSSSTNTVVELGQLIHDSVELMSFHAKRIRVRTRVQLTGEKMNVLGDRIELQQVFVNLLRNAFDAVEKRGPENRQVRINSSSDAEYWNVEIIDNGHGVPVEDYDKIFDTFYTTKHDGMGMGLAISRTIIQALEGRLTLEPSDSRETLFRICLPKWIDRNGSGEAKIRSDSICSR